MIVTDAFKDEFLAIQILVELERRLSASLMDFMIEFNAAAKQVIFFYFDPFAIIFLS